MERNYIVSLTNAEGATFDSEVFESIEDCKDWAKGRGQTYTHGKWRDYTVRITEVGQMDPVEEYKTR